VADPSLHLRETARDRRPGIPGHMSARRIHATRRAAMRPGVAGPRTGSRPGDDQERGRVGATCTMAVSRGDLCALLCAGSKTAESGLSPRRHGTYPEGGGNLRGLAPNWASGVLEMKKVFTTGQVAKICKVAPRTVSKWFDSGRLRGYRIPGSQDRRIP